MTNYIKISTAAEIAKVSMVSLYRAIQRGTLKHKMMHGIRYTTSEWLNEYARFRYDRQRVHFQGKAAFDYVKGEWSVRMVATYLNTSSASVHYLITMGYLKSSRKGTYHVVYKDDVDSMIKTRGYVRHIKIRRAA